MRRLVAQIVRRVDDARSSAHIRRATTTERQTLRMLNAAWRLP